jgi:hypothetical protein
MGGPGRSPDLSVEIHQRLEVEQTLLVGAVQSFDQQRQVHAKIARRCDGAARRRMQEPLLLGRHVPTL